MGLFKRYVTCIIVFFTPFTFVKLCKFYSITSPVFFTKNKKLQNERKEDFLHMYWTVSAYRVISDEVENHIFRRHN